MMLIMCDDVLREERIDLVDKMRRWITDYGQYLISEDEALAQLQRKTGLERGLSSSFYPHCGLTVLLV